MNCGCCQPQAVLHWQSEGFTLIWAVLNTTMCVHVCACVCVRRHVFVSTKINMQEQTCVSEIKLTKFVGFEELISGFFVLCVFSSVQCWAWVCVCVCVCVRVQHSCIPIWVSDVYRDCQVLTFSFILCYRGRTNPKPISNKRWIFFMFFIVIPDSFASWLMFLYKWIIKACISSKRWHYPSHEVEKSCSGDVLDRHNINFVNASGYAS